MSTGIDGRRYEFTLVLILMLAGGVAAVDAQTVFYIMPFIAQDLHLDNTQIGLIGSAVLVGWSLAALGVALLSDRMGRRKPFLVGAFVVFALFSGLSAAASSFFALFAARLVMGLAEGPVIPIQHVMVMAESAPQRRGLNMGIVQNFGAQLIGTLAAPILVVWLAQRTGWRSAFLLAGIPALLIALAIWKFVREPPGAAHAEPRSTTGNVFSRLPAIWAVRNIRISIAIGTCCVAWYFMMLTFLPLWLTKGLGLDPGVMSTVIAMMGAAGAAGAFLVAGLSDRIGRRNAMRLFCSIGFVAPIGVLWVGPHPLLLGAIVFLGSLMIGTFSLFMGTIPQESVDAADGATATALVLCIAQLAGGIVGPSLGGVLADRLGLQAPLLLAAGLALCGTMLSFSLRESGLRGRG